MGPEIVWTFLWVSTATGVMCLVGTMTFIACGGLIKRYIWKWFLRQWPALKELITCIKDNDDEGAIIALQLLVEGKDENV
jgi:hypothetical protein